MNVLNATISGVMTSRRNENISHISGVFLYLSFFSFSKNHCMLRFLVTLVFGGVLGHTDFV